MRASGRDIMCGKDAAVLTKDCIALKVTANFCVSTTVGASLPILPIDWAKADPPNLRESEEKSI